MYDQLPNCLKKRKQFCNWRREQRNDRMTKVPYRTNGKRANPTDPKCFTDFNSVCATQDAYEGIGIGIFGDLFAIDIDHCVVGGVVSEMAQAIIDTMNCYTEYSSSGTGIRIIGLVSDLDYDKARYYINNHKLGLEVYVAGYTSKFVTLTGNAIRESDLVDRSKELMTVLDKYMVKPVMILDMNREVPGSYLSDASVISKAMASKQGEKFSSLWEGNIPVGSTHSEADQALCTMLAFWCGGDTDQMDRLFQESGLMREKWNREDYRTATLDKAVAMTTEFYKPLAISDARSDFSNAALFLNEVHPENNSQYPWTDIGRGRLLADCRAGKIDHIVTKSISRLARNTVTLLETVRELKSLGISIYFEEQNIDTATADGELMLSILASYAQEESLSNSENMKWRIHSNFQNGLAWNPTLLGYRYDGGTYNIEPTEAETVRLIFDSYLEGRGATAIAKMLNESTAVSRFGNSWGQRSIMQILQNYTYTGNLMLQKKYTVDFLTKTMKVNEGEVPQYYVEDSHPAIIKPTEWEAVQVEMEQRQSRGRRHDCGSPFSGKIFCGDCSGVYGSKTWHSTDKYRRVIWQCDHKYDSGEKCGTPHLREEVLKERFVEALGQYMDDPEERLEGLRYIQKAMTDTTFIDADLEETGQKMELLSGMIRNCIMMNASAAVGEREYQQQYAELTRQFEEQKERYEALQDRRKQMNETAIIFGGMLFELWELDEISVTFKESLWHTLVDHATVYADERIVFRFKDGTEIATML